MSEASEKLRKAVEAGKFHPPHLPAIGDMQLSIGDQRALLAERTWRPIETAPRDTWVLLWWPGTSEQPTVGFCKHGFWADQTLFANPKEPTHWMPLPPPPKAKQPQELPPPRLPPREEPT